MLMLHYRDLNTKYLESSVLSYEKEVHWCVILCVLVYICACVGGCVRMTVVVMSDKLFVLPHKCTLN